ncbi:MAG TPA: hypothetical protein PKD00_04080 [Burkholderiales bacterium]|nr:hypothetical protein [Burkholderiales bacterium]
MPILKNLFNKIKFKYFFIKNLFSFSNYYLIKFEEYYYCIKANSYILVFRLRNKTLIQKLTINEAFFNKNFLKYIHPLDAYKIGIISGMQRNKIIFNTQEYKKNANNQKILKIAPLFLIKSFYLLDNNTDIVVYLVNSDSKFHIKLQDIPTKLFLIYGLNPIHAATIGLLVSEYFIKKLNF